MAKLPLTAVVTYLVLISLHASYAYKFLMLPIVGGSHVISHVAISKELIKQGHEVHILMGDTVPDYLSSNASKLIVHRYGQQFKDDMPSYDEVVNLILNDVFAGKNSFNELMKLLTGVMAMEHTRLLTDNDELLQQLDRIKFDIAVVDSLFFAKYAYLIPHYLKIPWVTYTDAVPFELVRVPWLPSFVPLKMLQYSEKMTFTERLINTVATIFFSLKHLPEPEEQILTKYKKVGEFSSLNDLISRSVLFLTTSHELLSYPVPLMPNLIQVGGVTTSPAGQTPLPQDIETVLQSAKLGAIVMSFGSMVPKFADHIATKFIDAFRRLPNYRIIWRNNDTNMDIPENVMIRKWLPQNDMLADSRVKLFITHCGNNGQLEAVYHGVPMIGFPLWGDQPHNAVRLSYKGYGIAMNIHDFTTDELIKNIETVINDENYKKRVKLASEIFKSDPQTPAEKAVYWLNHVAKFGGDHLRSAGNDLAWYQYMLLDVIGVLLSILAVVSYLVLKFLKFCASKICKQTDSDKKLKKA